MNTLKNFRIKKKLRQLDVANLLGVTQTQYHRLETGKSLLNSNQIMVLCRLYQCSPNDLLDFKSQYQIIMEETYHSKK